MGLVISDVNIYRIERFTHIVFYIAEKIVVYNELIKIPVSPALLVCFPIFYILHVQITYLSTI